jgi:hypothetical protein
MTYPLQENADGVFANRILRPEPEMQAIFTEIGLRTCGHGSFPLPAGLPCRRRQGKKSPATANFLFDAQPNLFGIARQIKKSANFVHGLFAYRLAERRGFEPLKPFRGLLAFQAGQFNHSCTFPRIKKKNQPSDRLILCGERGIRTPGTVARTPHFECGPIDHSGISPKSPRNGGSPAFRPRRERRLSSFRGCKYKQNFSDCSFS